MQLLHLFLRDWYKLSEKDISESGGKGLLELYENKLCRLLESIFPGIVMPRSKNHKKSNGKAPSFVKGRVDIGRTK